MQQSQIYLSAGYRVAIAGLLDGVLGSSASVVLSGAAGAGKTAVLNAAMAEFARGSARVIHVTAAAARPLALQEFTAQVAGLQDPESLTDEALERAFEALTVPDDRSRIVLIVDGAEALPPETLRYIQLACKLQPLLQAVFSGRPEFEDHLKDGEFSFLRGRLARTLALSPLSDDEAAGFVEHRLRAAGLPSGEMAASDALGALLRHGRGNPGRIGAILDQALAAQRRERQRPASGIAADEAPRAVDAEVSAARVRLAVSSALLWAGARRELRPPAWVMVWMVLIAEVALSTFMLSRLPVQSVQLAAAERAPAAASLPASPLPPAILPEVERGDQVVVAEARPAESEEGLPTSALPSAEGSTAGATEQAPPPASLAAERPEPPEPADAPPGASRPGRGTRLAMMVPAPARRPPGAAAPSLTGDEAGRAVRPGRAGRIAAALATETDDRHCRSIVLRVQLGEDPTDADRRFLRSGCRPGP